MLVLVALLAGAEMDWAGPSPGAHAVQQPTPIVRGRAPAPEVDELIVSPPKDAEPEWSRRLNFDVRGEYAPSGTPYLRQRPTNGCKLMAGGATSLIDENGVAGGLVCVKRF